jgi:hypothetical protein
MKNVTFMNGSARKGYSREFGASCNSQDNAEAAPATVSGEPTTI